MGWILSNFDTIGAVAGGLGSLVGIGAFLWGRRLKKAVEKLADLIERVINARKDGVITEKEIKEIINASTQFLIAVIPFWRDWMGKRKKSLQK